MEEAFTTLTSVVFSIGEMALTKHEQEKTNSLNNTPHLFFTHPEMREHYEKRWLLLALREAMKRKIGESNGIQLANGSLLTREKIETGTHPEYLPFFDAFVKAQVNGGNEEDVAKVAQMYSQSSFFIQRMSDTCRLLTEMYGPKETIVPMEKIWESFFSRTFSVAEEAIQCQFVSVDDVLSQEGWLYLGLTSCTALDCVLRSLPSAPSCNTTTHSVSSGGPETTKCLHLALGERLLTKETVPPEGAPFFAALLQLRDAVASANLNTAEVELLRLKALTCDQDVSDQQQNVDINSKLLSVEKAVPSSERKQLILRLVGVVQSIAVQASQQEIFKAHMDNVLTLLQACLQ